MRVLCGTCSPQLLQLKGVGRSTSKPLSKRTLCGTLGLDDEV